MHRPLLQYVVWFTGQYQDALQGHGEQMLGQGPRPEVFFGWKAVPELEGVPGKTCASLGRSHGHVVLFCGMHKAEHSSRISQAGNPAEASSRLRILTRSSIHARSVLKAWRHAVGKCGPRTEAALRRCKGAHACPDGLP